MQISYSPKPHNMVDYYPLPNGYADVFMHRNERTETDEDGNTVYAAEEAYLRVSQDITKKHIENNFGHMWNDAENTFTEPTAEERLQALESAMLEMILGGMV